MRPDLPTGTVTFLFTDIEGSTRLLQRLGPREESRVLRVDGPTFDRARTEGRLLSIAEAADLDSRRLG